MPTPKTIQYVDHIAGVETALTEAKFPLETSEEIKAKVCNLFRNTESNMTKPQRRAISNLKRDDIVILKADKGNAMVVMSKEEYQRKSCELLQPPTYLPLPTPKVEMKVLTDMKCIDKMLFYKLKTYPEHGTSLLWSPKDP